jgi:Fe-S oxidoreductase
MAGRLGESGLGDEGVYSVLDLCLECRACKAECPVGVDVARFKSEFLADYWARHGAPLGVRLLGNADGIARWGSRLAPVLNRAMRARTFRSLNERLFGIDRRRSLPEWSNRTFARAAAARGNPEAAVLLFNDTFTNYYNPEIGIAVCDVLEAAGVNAGVAANECCGRPSISKGLLARAREQARRNTERLYQAAERGCKFIFCEPSCLSAMREDAPSLLRGEEQRKARVVGQSCLLFEEFLGSELDAGRLAVDLAPGPARILMHAHCHQKAMGLLPITRALLSRIPGVNVTDPDAGCCGMAGSFGYGRDHFEISRQIGERRLFPAIRQRELGTVIVASGVSCRHQIKDFTGETAIHPAMLLQLLLRTPA